MASPRSTLSEYASKRLLASYGVPLAREALVDSASAAAAAAAELGFPVALKLCGDAVAHKTERDLVRLNLGDASAVEAAARELLGRALPEDGEVGLLVAEMVRGNRELIAGVVRDPVFGPCVMLGLGGVLTEALGDVVFAAAPLEESEARRLLGALQASHLLGEFRGEPPVDADALVGLLVGLGRLASERPDIASIDINPLIVRAGLPVAVDALVELADGAAAPIPESEAVDDAEILERFRPLFHPRGIIVAGASTHPGKFGFVVFHNLLRFGYHGEVFPVNRDGSDILGRPSFKDVSEIPDGAADLVFVCTPNQANLELLRACAKKGVRAAFIASAGYGEAGDAGRARESELVALADELGILLIGPNGQGVISTPHSMCAQIVAPYPPAGRISVASQSGNLVSSYLNYAVESGVGISKAISCGNSAQTTLADCFDYFGADPETDVVLGYLEGVAHGRHFIESLRRLTARKPLVLVKGGAAAAGARAAASHTGSLATDDRVFDGVLRQHGALRAQTVEEAFEWAATLATQPLPRGRRVVVFTTAGGWGVLAADACAQAGLDLIALPDDIIRQIDELVPARWSRNNPVDLAGGETRDTIPEVLDLICANDEVDAVIHLGIGIQAASAEVLATGEFHPEYGLGRIVDFHRRQDRRYAAAARAASERYGKPVLSATELVHTDRAYGNAGPQGIKEEGRLCHASAHRAIRSLRALVDYAEFRATR
ncbi:MAG: acetate--CoA ligase family protein [Deltaproteobacteria bacterium]|nr:acetate--CoA ligase family protein [Deltaproteobacteria bacterium]